jgi:hypothetical protein
MHGALAGVKMKVRDAGKTTRGLLRATEPGDCVRLRVHSAEFPRKFFAARLLGLSVESHEQKWIGIDTLSRVGNARRQPEVERK